MYQPLQNKLLKWSIEDLSGGIAFCSRRTVPEIVTASKGRNTPKSILVEKTDAQAQIAYYS